MATTITWSIDSHKHETAGKKCILNVSYRVTGVDGDITDSIHNEIKLDRPSDSDMQDYATFLGSGDTALVAAVKAQLGDDKVKAHDDAVTAKVAELKAPVSVWTQGPTAS